MSEGLRPQPGQPETWRHGALSCRVCGHELDAAASTDGSPTAAPKNNDWSVCLECGEVSLFVVGPFGVALREPTMDEIAAFARSPHAEAVRRVHEIKRRGKR